MVAQTLDLSLTQKTYGVAKEGEGEHVERMVIEAGFHFLSSLRILPPILVVRHCRPGPLKR